MSNVLIYFHLTNYSICCYNLCSEQKVLDEEQCLQKAGNKPATEKSCNVGKKCPQWHIGDWKPVSF